eukprot:NODE_2_length_91304_cov_0.692462.p24 type:complete len:378 gc:universal NODE_2_length_91304_cov_0.692462:30697-31830(+)
METLSICSQCKQNQPFICLSCVQKEKNTLRTQLPDLRKQYGILEKKLQPQNWNNSFTLFKHWRDVFITKCQIERRKIGELQAKINALRSKIYFEIPNHPKVDEVDINNNFTKIQKFKETQVLDLRFKLQIDFYHSLDMYSSYRNDTAYANIIGSIPCPIQISVFQLPIEDLLGILGHSCLVLKLFEKFYGIELQFDYQLRNSHSKVSVHHNMSGIPVLQEYEYDLYIPESVFHWKNEKDENLDVNYIKNFIIAISLLIYEISCLYEIQDMMHFIKNPFSLLLNPPNEAKYDRQVLEIMKLVVEEFLKVPAFNNLLEQVLRPSGYGMINEISSESSTHSLEDYTILKVTEEQPHQITEIWEDLKYHLKLLHPPFDILN